MATDPGVKKIFESLAREEMAHEKRFELLKAALPESAYDVGPRGSDAEMDRYLKMLADMNVFRSDLKIDEYTADMDNETTALQLALRFEKDSIVFFLMMQELMEREEDRKLVGQLMSEELQHIKKLCGELERLSKAG